MFIGIDARELQLKEMTDIKRSLLNFLHCFNQSHYRDRCILFSQRPLVDVKTERVENYVISSEFDVIWEHFLLSLAIKKYGVDLFYSPYCQTPLLSGVKKICCADGLSSQQDSFFYREMVPRFLKNADHVLVRSQMIKEQIMAEHALSFKKIDVLPLAIADVYYSEKTKDAIKETLSEMNIKEPYILFVISKVSEDVLTSIFNIVSLLVQKDSTMSFVLEVSSLEDIAIVKEKMDASLVHRVIVLSKGDEKSRSKLYQGAFLCIVSCQEDEFSTSLIEAMASSIPVICSNTMSAPEVMAGAGLLVDMADAKDVLKAIDKVSLDSFLRQDMVNRGRVRAKDFDQRRIVNKMYDIFRYVCGI